MGPLCLQKMPGRELPAFVALALCLALEKGDSRPSMPACGTMGGAHVGAAPGPGLSWTGSPVDPEMAACGRPLGACSSGWVLKS